MAIKLTDEENIVLNKFSYMNIKGIDDFVEKRLTLQQISTELLYRRNEAIRDEGEIPSFGRWGGITDKEQYEMLETMAKEGDKKYRNIYNLRLKDFYHNPSTDFYAYAFHEDGNPENTISIPRGTMGTQTHNNSLLQLADGFTNKYWRDNGYMGLFGVSVHYSEAREFVEKNKGTGQTLCTGFSAAATYCAYVAATLEGIGGTGFNGPGIGLFLTEEQRNRLGKSEYESKTCVADPVGSLFYHPERHEYTQCLSVIDRDINGEPIYENGVLKYKTGLTAGHYIQAVATDPQTGMTIAADQTEDAKRIEELSQQAYLVNKVTGNPLGRLLDGLTVGKGVLAPAMKILGAIELSQIENGDRKAANEELAKEAVREMKDTIVNRAKVSVESTALDINQTLDTLKPTRQAVEEADKLEVEAYQPIGKKINEAIVDKAQKASGMTDQGADFDNEVKAGDPIRKQIENVIKKAIEMGGSINDANAERAVDEIYNIYNQQQGFRQGNKQEPDYKSVSTAEINKTLYATWHPCKEWYLDREKERDELKCKPTRTDEEMRSRALNQHLTTGERDAEKTGKELYEQRNNLENYYSDFKARGQKEGYYRFYSKHLPEFMKSKGQKAHEWEKAGLFQRHDELKEKEDSNRADCERREAKLNDPEFMKKVEQSYMEMKAEKQDRNDRIKLLEGEMKMVKSRMEEINRLAKYLPKSIGDKEVAIKGDPKDINNLLSQSKEIKSQTAFAVLEKQPDYNFETGRPHEKEYQQQMQRGIERSM
jgi:hypothetical protein